MSVDTTELTQLAEEVSQREHCRLYDLEFVTGHRGKGRILRVYIDKEKDGEHASIEDCANVSRGLSLLLDVKDIVEGGRYELEVSTPGLERKLRLPWHFQRAKGKTVQIRLSVPFTLVQGSEVSVPPKTVKGELVEVTETDLSVSSEGRLWKGSIESVDRAQVVFMEMKKNRGG